MSNGKAYYLEDGEHCKTDYFPKKEFRARGQTLTKCYPCPKGYGNEYPESSITCHKIEDRETIETCDVDHYLKQAFDGDTECVPCPDSYENKHPESSITCHKIGEPAIAEEIVSSSTFIEDVTEVIKNSFTPTEPHTEGTKDGMISYTPDGGNSTSNEWIQHVAVIAAILGFICVAVIIFVVVKRRWESAYKPEDPQIEATPLNQQERQREHQDN